MPYEARVVATLLYLNSQLEAIDRHLAENSGRREMRTLKHELEQVKLVLQGPTASPGGPQGDE